MIGLKLIDVSVADCRRELDALVVDIRRIGSAIRLGGDSPRLRSEMTAIEHRSEVLCSKLDQLERMKATQDGQDL